MELITKTIIQALALDFDDCPDVAIYILRAADHVLYVGMTERHISWRVSEHLHGGGSISLTVRGCFPDSYKWCFDLYTKNEAARLAGLPTHCALYTIEKELIRVFSPSLNSHVNPNGRGLPPEIEMRLVNLETTVSDFVPF